VAITGAGSTVDYPWRSVPGRWTRWWLQPYDRAGERLVGIAVAEIAEHHKRSGRSCQPHPDQRPAPRPPASRIPPGMGPLLAELPVLCDHLESLLAPLDRLARTGRP
jgi:hypothetical protein